MDTPFAFGRLADLEDFANRKSELQRLQNNFISGTNSILISPRRWGKSSLVRRAALETMQKRKDLVFVFIDLYNTQTEEQFYHLLAKETVKSLSTKMEDWMDASKNFLTRYLPKISFSPSPEVDISIQMDWEELKKEPGEIINLPENLASRKKKKIVVCIDEFQNINQFGNPLAFQKRLRANWQLHKWASYCLYGSKRQMMTEVFSSSDMPFFKFGDIIFLEKISTSEWIKFIIKRFKDTGKTIDKKIAEKIARIVENHPFYVQQIAQLVWYRTKRVCYEKYVDDAFENLALQLSMLFQSITDSLSFTQINFLQALLDGVTQYSAQETLIQYRLGTSANIQQIKKALLEKEIIDIQDKEIILLDPLYKYWLQSYYFKNKF